MNFSRQRVSKHVHDQVLTANHSEKQQNEIWLRVEPILKDEFADIYGYLQQKDIFDQYPARRHTDIILGSGLAKDFEANLPWIAGYLNLKSTALLHSFATQGMSGNIIRGFLDYAGKFIRSNNLEYIFDADCQYFMYDDFEAYGHGSKAGSLGDMSAKYIRSARAMIALDKTVFSGTQPGVEKDVFYNHGIEVEDICRFDVLVEYVRKNVQPKEPEWPILPIWLTDEVQYNEPVVSILETERRQRKAWCESNGYCEDTMSDGHGNEQEEQCSTSRGGGRVGGDQHYSEY